MNHADVSLLAYTPSRQEIDSAVSLLRSLGFTVVRPSVHSGAGSAQLPPTLDLNWRALTYGERRIQLSPFHARIVHELIDSSPAWCSRYRLRRALWGDTIPTSDPLPVHMHYVSKKLRNLTGRQDVVASSYEGFLLSPDLVARR